MARPSSRPPMVAEIGARELAELLRDRTDALLLLDVREDDERATAAIAPSVHIPMQQIPGRWSELPRDRRIIVYCHHGNRSEMVAGYLEACGIDRVANLTGGIDAWSTQVDPRVPRY